MSREFREGRPPKAGVMVEPGLAGRGGRQVSASSIWSDSREGRGVTFGDLERVGRAGGRSSKPPSTSIASSISASSSIVFTDVGRASGTAGMLAASGIEAEVREASLLAVPSRKSGNEPLL